MTMAKASAVSFGLGPGARSADRVYEAIRKAILDGALTPGDRLLEETLAEQLEVSRTPVREALTRLEAERFLERLPRLGLRVAVVSQREIEEVYAVREALEGVAARLCAEVASKTDKQRLAMIEDEFEDAIAGDDVDAIYHLNLELHNEIARCSRNETLLHHLEQIHTAIQRHGKSILTYAGRAQQSADEHRDLLSAIDAQDGELAERLARRHIENARVIRIQMHVRRRREGGEDQ